MLAMLTRARQLLEQMQRKAIVPNDTTYSVSLGVSAAGHGDKHVLSAVHEPTRQELTTFGV